MAIGMSENLRLVSMLMGVVRTTDRGSSGVMSKQRRRIDTRVRDWIIDTPKETCRNIETMELGI